MNPKLNEFCRIDYEFIQPIKDKINLQYLEIYQVIKDIDLFLNNGKEFDYDLEKLKKLVSNSQNQIFEISKNSLKNMNKKIKEESKKRKKN